MKYFGKRRFVPNHPFTDLSGKLLFLCFFFIIFLIKQGQTIYVTLQINTFRRHVTSLKFFGRWQNPKIKPNRPSDGTRKQFYTIAASLHRPFASKIKHWRLIHQTFDVPCMAVAQKAGKNSRPSRRLFLDAPRPALFN